MHTWLYDACISLYACMWICMYVYMIVCILTWISMCVFMYAYVLVCLGIHVRMRVNVIVCLCVRANMNIQEFFLVCLCLFMRAYITSGLRGPSPQALTLFGGVGFIARRLRRPEKGNADGVRGIFGTAYRVGLRPCDRTHLKNGLVPYSYVGERRINTVHIQ